MTEFPEDPRGRELILMLERAKYDRWLANEIADILARAFNEVVNTILSPGFRTLSQFEQARKFQLFRELDRQIKLGYQGVTTTVLREMQGYATIESDVARAQIKSMLTGASGQIQAQIGAMLTRHTVSSIAALPVQGLNIGDWFEAQAAGMSRETRRIIQNGLLQGKSIPEMVRAIVPPRTSTEPALYRRARNDAMVITRTTVNAVQNHAAQTSYEAAGEDVSDSYRLLVVKDARTSAICRALADRVFRYDDPKKMIPPFHVSCRTTQVPLVRDAFLSLKEQKATPHTFASYADWLREQSASQQDSILGPQRATWWRDGKMTLADAVDDDQRVLTLEQLRKRLPIAEHHREPASVGL